MTTILPINDKQKAIDSLAERLALCLNGGEWNIHYTHKQKDVWRKRAETIIDRQW